MLTQPSKGRHLSERDVIKSAARAALSARTKLGYPLGEPCCVYDAIERAEIELRFVDIPSLEGLYASAEVPSILVSIHRPPGRRRLTAAHELGHHWFADGTRVDQLASETLPVAGKTEEELKADVFGSFFLMPKSLVLTAFERRGWSIATLTPEQVFVVAGWLGVGYSSLITHLRFSLRLISFGQAAALMAVAVKHVRRNVIGRAVLHEGIVVDEQWTGRPVDASVGDVLRVPPRSLLDGNIGELSETAGVSYVTLTAPGLGRVDNGEWAAYVRVSERDFVGRAIFRHLPRED
jgi:Zn-dependent peptidase ImmA (M78 family)